MIPNNLNKLILILALILLFTNLFFIDLANPKAILSNKKVIEYYSIVIYNNDSIIW